MLPINRPKCPFMDNHYDGKMNFMNTDESPSAREVNYFPSVVNSTW
jgi:catalase